MISYGGTEKLSPLFTRDRINSSLNETINIVSGWKHRVTELEVPKSFIAEVVSNLRLGI